MSAQVTGLGSSSTVCTGSGGRDVVTGELSVLLAGESKHLVLLAALRNLDAVLVAPVLDLALGPGVEENISNLLGSSRASRRDGSRGTGSVCANIAASDVGVATNSGDQLVTRAGLRNGNTTLVHPRLEIRVAPGVVEPVTGVSGVFLGLFGGALVALTSRRQETVTSAGLRVGDSMAVEEGLELRLRPALRMSIKL